MKEVFITSNIDLLCAVLILRMYAGKQQRVAAKSFSWIFSLKTPWYQFSTVCTVCSCWSSSSVAWNFPLSHDSCTCWLHRPDHFARRRADWMLKGQFDPIFPKVWLFVVEGFHVTVHASFHDILKWGKATDSIALVLCLRRGLSVVTRKKTLELAGRFTHQRTLICTRYCWNE